MKSLFILVSLFCFVLADKVAIVKYVDGKVFAKTQEKVVLLKSGDFIDEKTIVESKDGSGITLVFNDDSFLILGENTLLNVEKYLFKEDTKEYEFELFLKKGTASFESGKIGTESPESFIFKTPEGVVAIRGTKFLVKVE